MPFLLVLLSFLAGSIPFSWLIARAKGVDLRRVGSGNVGATNLGRALGRRYFFLGFFLDMLKGLLPVLFAGWSLGVLGKWETSASSAAWWIGCVLASVLGHVFTPWLKFKGGKGVATAFGAMLGMFPVLTLAAGACLLAYGVGLALTRRVSVGSLCAAFAAPIAPLVLLVRRLNAEPATLSDGPIAEIAWGSIPLSLGATLVLSGLVIWTHRGNIARLRAGTEPRIGQRAEKR